MSLGTFTDHGHTAFMTASEGLQSRWNRKTPQTHTMAAETGTADHLCVLIHG